MKSVLGFLILSIAFDGMVIAQTCDQGSISDFQFSEENDALAVFSGSDEAYTQGLRFSWTYLQGCAPRWSGGWGQRKLTSLGSALLEHLYVDVPDADYAYTLEFGQNFFTPNDISKPKLIRDDRPYAGWLYGGVSYAVVDNADNDLARRQHQFEFQLGIIGPQAQGEFVQREFHRLIHNRLPKGWDNQLGTELGAELFYTHQRRWVSPGKHFDAIPSLVAAFGNIQDYLGLGLIARMGTSNMKAFPVSIITASAAKSRAERRILETYVFIGGEARAIFRNIYLDGNTFKDSHHVNKEGFVYDLKAGGSLRFKSLRLTYTFVRRSREFSPDPRGVDASKHDYGSVTLGWERSLGGL